MLTPVERAGHQVMLLAVILVGVGVVMIYSSSSALAGTRFEDSAFFLERQLLRAGMGLAVMFALSRVPLGTWRLLARPLLVAGLALLGLVLVFGEGRGTQRWLDLSVPGLPSIAFQPSEFAKFALVLYLADVLDRHAEAMADWRRGLLPRILVVGTVQVLVVLQPDLGTAIAIGAVALTLLWLGGARTLHLGLACLAAGGIAALSVLSSPYQMARIDTFLGDPDPQGAGFQVAQALLALGSGGLFGVGLGNSMQKHFLPEPHTDFVFAFAGEELGLFGTLSILALFAALAIQGYRIATRAATYHGFLVASGITLMISVYALLNVSVATGLAPTTGLPLPFISYGGSSLMWNLSGIGILAGVARQRDRPAAVGRNWGRLGPATTAKRWSPRGAGRRLPGWLPPSAPGPLPG